MFIFISYVNCYGLSGLALWQLVLHCHLLLHLLLLDLE